MYKTQKEIDEDVEYYSQYGKCSMCGCDLPEGYATGLCSDCEYEMESRY